MVVGSSVFINEISLPLTGFSLKDSDNRRIFHGYIKHVYERVDLPYLLDQSVTVFERSTV